MGPGVCSSPRGFADLTDKTLADEVNGCNICDSTWWAKLLPVQVVSFIGQISN